ncbi:MAG TPA: DUF2478 domain-containing protein [Paracoccus sp.]|nr:DUF2478 domain-containing protein [Paracoccus sp. (in: a-proteobacteria)]
MELRYVSLPGRGANDRFLARIAGMLLENGLKLTGTMQVNIARADRHKCDMDLRILPDGPVLRISEDRGREARGCILDAGALEQAVEDVSRRLPRAGILLVNKFGRQEAEGRGFAPVIAEALAQGVPVLVGVNGLNLEVFQAFAGGVAQPLPAEAGQVLDWCLARRCVHAA